MRVYTTDKRIHEDFLEAYLQYTSRQESPEMFHRWVCISIIAGALDRNVYMDRGYYQLFPNLYIVLCAQSARLRKTVSSTIGAKLLYTALGNGINYISQKITPEALIQELHKRFKKYEQSTGYIYSPEFAVFIGNSKRGDDTLISLMTDLYDPKDRFAYTTITRGEIVCEYTCVNMLSATTPEWLKTSLPEYAIGGGFTSRIIFVFQSSTDRVVPFPHLSNKEKALKDELMHDLRMIHRMRGEYELTPEASNYYEDWYIKLYNPDAGADSIKGYLGRKHEMVLKIAIVLAASRRANLIITEDEIEEALKILTENERELPGVMEMVQSSEGGATNMRVYQIIRRREDISHTDLLRSCCHFVDARQLSDIIETLGQANMIIALTVKGKVKYKATD